MRIGKLYFGWGAPSCTQFDALRRANEKIKELQKELLGPQNSQDSQDRNAILKYLEDQARDELEALDKGLDRHWRKVK